MLNDNLPVRNDAEKFVWIGQEGYIDIRRQIRSKERHTLAAFRSEKCLWSNGGISSIGQVPCSSGLKNDRDCVSRPFERQFLSLPHTTAYEVSIGFSAVAFANLLTLGFCYQAYLREACLGMIDS